MPAAPLPHDELERLATLASCRIVGTPKEKGFDAIALVASLLAGVPIAFVSFVDAGTTRPRSTRCRLIIDGGNFRPRITS